MTANWTERAYLETHPWINFSLNIVEFSHATWLLFGEAESKCSHVAGVPLRPEVARKLHTVYLSKGIHGTTAIEGNTLSVEEVAARVEGDLPLPPSREYLGREIDNIVDACNDIANDVVEGRSAALTPGRIKEFNQRILAELPLKEGVVPGHVRTHSVGVAGYRGAPAEDCEYLLEELCSWLERIDRQIEQQEELRFTLVVMKAILAHLYIAWIHPFGDGNGRTARLIEFELMVQAGIPLPAAHLLSDHYNRTREVYYIELDKTSHGSFAIEPFVRYALRGFVDELREQLAVIREEQMEVTWENYVHSHFRDHETPARRRQKHLVLDMPKGEVVPIGKLREVSMRVALEYSSKTAKTVTRDVNALTDWGLVRRVRGGVIANRKVIKAFLPVKSVDGHV
ncbi:Fic family protein [Nocardioides sp. NPDC000445]|uniref:Fic family protein n=1 Tax=Nocardioides sp. NPDC000445 TaxID=3154257 RepID=UPI0033227350